MTSTTGTITFTQRHLQLTTPHGHLAVGARTDEPRLTGHPSERKDAKTVPHVVPAQDFERHDERVRHQVVVYPRVEDLDRAVVRRRREQWVRRVKLY